MPMIQVLRRKNWVALTNYGEYIAEAKGVSNYIKMVGVVKEYFDSDECQIKVRWGMKRAISKSIMTLITYTREKRGDKNFPEKPRRS